MKVFMLIEWNTFTEAKCDLSIVGIFSTYEKAKQALLQCQKEPTCFDENGNNMSDFEIEYREINTFATADNGFYMAYDDCVKLDCSLTDTFGTMELTI